MTDTTQTWLPLHEPASITDTPDIHSSSETYARRFAGPVGDWFLEVQERALTELMRPWSRASVLDVGGGHGQVSSVLSDAGHDLTLLASCEAAYGRAMPLRDRGVDFVTGQLAAPPFREQAFDVVVSIRTMSHVPDWRALIAGLCRSARDGVIVDFPIPGGANALEPMFFHAKKMAEGDTRRFTTMSCRAVAKEFRRHGFEVDARFGQFVLPMVVHRMLKRPGLSRTLESALAAVGLRRLAGTPVLMRARRVR